MGNLQSILEEKNNSLSFKQYDKDSPSNILLYI